MTSVTRVSFHVSMFLNRIDRWSCEVVNYAVRLQDGHVTLVLSSGMVVQYDTFTFAIRFKDDHATLHLYPVQRRARQIIV